MKSLISATTYLFSMEDKHSLHQPFIPISTTFGRSSSASASAAAFSSSFHQNDKRANAKVSSSDDSLIIRLVLVLLVAAISLWANYEASKTFEITLINDAKDSPAGHRFGLFYVSNDRATRIVLNTSSFVEHLLYPDNLPHPKKHIDHVTLRLARRNLNVTVTVSPDGGKRFNGYVIDISPSLLEEANYKEAIVPAVQRAMARVWLWDGESRAPAGLIDGMVEYISEMAGFGSEKFTGGRSWRWECEDDAWWEDKDPRDVARFLRYCERYKEGFIGRLNQAMRDTWHHEMVDDALGMSAKKLCGSYNASGVPQKNIMLVDSI